jgi:transcriptional regulator with XRE-family HTH domain
MTKSKRPIPNEIFCRRLKEARLAVGYSQKTLGILAGIDEFVASTRINRYELGVHETDITTARRLADVLGVPLAYFFAEEDDLADMIRRFSLLDTKQRAQIFKKIGKMLSENREEKD